MTGQDLGASALDHLCISDSLLNSGKYSKLGGDRDSEVLV